MPESFVRLNTLLWSGPVLIALVAVGMYLLIRMRFLQIRCFPKALKHFIHSFKLNQEQRNGTSAYRALCTALAATVGTGNLAGVAGAIALGGPGVIFWMWVCAILGMGIKFAEVVLAMIYRKRNAKGEWVGGPMQFICCGLKKRYHFIAYIYCFFCVVASFGIGNGTQINAVICGLDSVFRGFDITLGTLSHVAIGLLLCGIVWVSFQDGSDRIGRITQMLIPLAAVLYMILALGILIIKRDALLSAAKAIIQGAFSPRAVTGGTVLSAFQTLRIGAARGLFTNEAGMGTAAIAHASAEVTDPVKQGLLGIMEVFIDTIVICSLTAFVILTSGVPIPYGMDTGIRLTMAAYASVYGNWVTIPVTLSVCLFALATILGWGLYGARSFQYLFGESSWNRFVMMQAAMVVVGSVVNTASIWLFSEFVNGLMVLTNLFVVIRLLPVLMEKLKSNV